jgi:hypothetical protein
MAVAEAEIKVATEGAILDKILGARGGRD